MNSHTDHRSVCFPGFTSSRAQGPMAGQIQSRFHEIYNRFLSSQSLGLPVCQSLVNLEMVFQKCSRPGWNGDGALPVTPRTYQNAKRFLEALAGFWPVPAIGAKPDGELVLEWNRGSRLRFAISVGPEPVVGYAGRFGGCTLRGTETVCDEVPANIVQQLRRLYRMAS